MWRYRIHRGKFKPTYRTYNTRNQRLLDISAVPPSRAGGCGCWRAEGTIWRNPSTGGSGLSASGHSVDCFNSHVFPKQEKKDTKGVL